MGDRFCSNSACAAVQSLYPANRAAILPTFIDGRRRVGEYVVVLKRDGLVPIGEVGGELEGPVTSIVRAIHAWSLELPVNERWHPPSTFR